MKRYEWFLRNTALIMVFIMFLMLPVTGSYAATEDESMGQTVAIGLFVVIIGVLAWLGLRSDMDSSDYAAPLEKTPYRYPDEYAMQEDISVASQDVKEHAALRINADGLQVAF